MNLTNLHQLVQKGEKHLNINNKHYLKVLFSVFYICWLTYTIPLTLK